MDKYPLAGLRPSGSIANKYLPFNLVVMRLGKMSMEDPIQDLEEIDIVGSRKDGGVDLVIVVSSYLDNTERNDYLLRTKVQNYINAILSDNWIEKYGEGNTDIYIKASAMPHQEMINLIGALKNFLKQYRVDLWLEVT